MEIEEPLVDNRGTTIKVGDKVAYNLSGEVAVGYVKSCTPAIKNGWQYIKHASIKVEQLYPAQKTSHLSSVRNPKNVLVLFEK
jgi:hypothetical protein